MAGDELGSRLDDARQFLKQLVFENDENQDVRNAWYSKLKAGLSPAEFLARGEAGS